MASFSTPTLTVLSVLITSLLWAGCGRANVIDVLLECPSPDGAVAAVLLVEGGGGAAGWTQDLISIQPAGANGDAVYLTDEPDEESVVLALNRGEGYLLRWESNNQLVIDVAYAPRTVVFSMRNTRMIRGRRVAVVYRKRTVEEEQFSMPSRQCESGSATITNPPSRRIR
jgi:hypothetical protein